MLSAKGLSNYAVSRAKSKARFVVAPKNTRPSTHPSIKQTYHSSRNQLHTSSATMTGPSFSDKMAGWLNGAAITLAISIGHQTGIFDAMDKLRKDGHVDGSSISEIATAAGLQARYVQVCWALCV